MGPLVICLVAFNAMFLVFDLFDHVSRFIQTQLSWIYILRYYAGLIATYSQWFMPASLMLATLYTMWQLSRNSEITAMRASGISAISLAAPFVALSIIVAALTAYTSEFYAPEAMAWSLRLKNCKFDIKEARQDVRLMYPYYNAAGRRMWSFDRVDIVSEASLSSVTNRLTVTQERADNINEWSVTADRADFLDGVWWLTHPRFKRYDIEGGELPTSDAPLGAPRIMSFPAFDETPRDILLETREWEVFSVRDMLRALRRQPTNDPAKHYDIQNRIASPWMCVVITLFSVPAGLATARQSILKGMFGALAAFFGMYALTHIGMFLSTQGYIPIWLAAWTPNTLFLLLSLRLYRRMI